MKGKIKIFLAWIVFLGLLGGICFVSIWQEYKEGNDLPVKVIFPRLQNDADCTLLVQGKKAVMIDTGEKDDAQSILKILAENSIERLDCLILTHPDADHIGGAEYILQNILVDKVIQPYYNEDNDNLSIINDLCQEMKLVVVYPVHTMRINVGEMHLLIYPPLEKHYNDTNNYSLAVLVQHDKVNMLFTGDALKKRTEELLMINMPYIQLLKVPHHGRANSISEKFLEEIYPEYAVVMAEKSDEIIEKTCNKLGIHLLHTGNSACLFESSGSELRLIQPEGKDVI